MQKNTHLGAGVVVGITFSLIAFFLVIGLRLVAEVMVAASNAATVTQPADDVDPPWPAPPVVEGIPPLPTTAPMPAAETADTTDFAKITRERRVLAYSLGLLLEGMANATPASTPFSAFEKQFLKQAGVQLQVAALDDAGAISRDPALAFAQGFFIGL